MAPKGKARPKSFTIGKKTYTYRAAPPAPGRLRASFGKKGAVKLSSSGKSILINSDLPYARIQDKGGIIPPYRQPETSPMMMFRAGGKVVFTRYRGRIKIKGQKYIQAAFNEWTSRRKIGKNIKVRWASRKGEKSVTADPLRSAPGGI